MKIRPTPYTRLLAMLCVCSSCMAQPVLAQTARSLEYYLDIAVKNSPLLKDYGYQVMANRMDSLSLRAQNAPQVNGNVLLQYMPAGVNNDWGYDNAVTNGGNYVAQVAASQNILNKNILKPQFEIISIQGKILGQTAKISSHDLEHNVTGQYLAAWNDWQQIQSTRQTLALMRDELNTMKTMVNAGLMKQTAYLSFNMEIENAQLNLQQLLMQYATDLLTMNVMCGLNDTSTAVTLLKPELKASPVRLNYELSQGYMQTMLDSMRIANQKALSDIRYKPHLQWMADAGFLSSTPDLYMHPGFSIGLALSVPIYDGHQRSIDYQKINLQEKSRASYYNFNKNQFDRQYEMYSRQLAATNALIANIQKQIETNNQLMTATEKELNTGDMSVTDLILIVRTKIDLLNTLNQNQVKALQIINDMNYYNW